jgi:hypothetical protein
MLKKLNAINALALLLTLLVAVWKLGAVAFERWRPTHQRMLDSLEIR